MRIRRGEVSCSDGGPGIGDTVIWYWTFGDLLCIFCSPGKI
jgi:hypothetical protein